MRKNTLQALIISPKKELQIFFQRVLKENFLELKTICAPNKETLHELNLFDFHIFIIDSTDDYFSEYLSKFLIKIRYSQCIVGELPDSLDLNAFFQFINYIDKKDNELQKAEKIKKAIFKVVRMHNLCELFSSSFDLGFLNLDSEINLLSSYGRFNKNFENSKTVFTKIEKNRIKKIVEQISLPSLIDIEFFALPSEHFLALIKRSQLHNGYEVILLNSDEMNLTPFIAQAERREAIKNEQELEALKLVSNVVNNAKSLNELLEGVTSIIGEMLYPDNFGIVLCCEDSENLVIHSSYYMGKKKVEEQCEDVPFYPPKGCVVWEVAQTGKSILIDDIRTKPNYYQFYKGMQSELVVPIKVGERVVGVINIERSDLNAFSKRDERLVSTIANQIGTSIDKLRVLEAEKIARIKAETLEMASSISNSQTGIADLLKQLIKVIPFKYADLFLLNDDKKSISLHAQYRQRDDIVEGVKYSLEDAPLISKTLHTRNMMIEDVTIDNKQFQAILLPLIARKKSYGVLTLDITSTRLDCDLIDRNFLNALADNLSLVIYQDDLIKQMNETIRFEQSLNEIIRTLSDFSTPYSQALNKVAEIICGIVGMKGVLIALLDDKKENLHALGIHNFTDIPVHLNINEGVSWQTIKEKRTLIHNNYSSHPKKVKRFEFLKNFITVPIFASQEVVGIIYLISDKEIFKNNNMIIRMESLGRQIGVTMKNRDLYSKVVTSLKREHNLNKALSEISKNNKIKDILNDVVQSCKKLISIDGIYVCLLNPDKETLKISINTKTKNEFIEDYPLNQAQFIKDIFNENKKMYIKDYNNYYNKPVQLNNRDLISVKGFPVRHQDQIIGAIILGNSSQDFIFEASDEIVFESIALMTGATLQNVLYYNELKVNFLETVSALANAIEMRDLYTHDHGTDIANYAVKIGEALNFSYDELENLRWGGLLHDIGKIGIPDNILNKKEELTENEITIIRTHPVIGASIIEPIDMLYGAMTIILHHHEFYDGTGYPFALKGKEIPLKARIVSVADAYSAMIDERFYNKPKTQKEAIKELKKYSGSQFDPEIVDIFIDILNKEKQSIQLL